MDFTPKQVAEWMLDELKGNKYLSQDATVIQIARKFGRKFIYTNVNGNLAIDKKVLAEFRKLYGDSVVWHRSEQAWRPRNEYDKPKRLQE